MAIQLKIFDAGRHRDDHRRDHVIGARIGVEPDGEHMVRPDDEAEKTDTRHGPDHRHIAENRLTRESGDHFAHDAESRKNQYVDFRMAEEPEKMLEQHRIAATGGIEESSAEIAVRQQHGDCTTEHRQREQQQECGDENRPREERHTQQGHARGAHVENGDNEN